MANQPSGFSQNWQPFNQHLQSTPQNSAFSPQRNWTSSTNQIPPTINIGRPQLQQQTVLRYEVNLPRQNVGSSPQVDDGLQIVDEE